MAPAEIRASLRDLAAGFGGAPRARIFKKIDSTMRGNVGMEVAAARDAFQCDAAVVCPAFPAMGRIVEQGTLRVSGSPEFAPVDVAGWLRVQSGEACVALRHDDVAAALAAGARLIAVDAGTDDDLDAIAAAVMRAGRRVLWAGSAGLASALARCLENAEAPDAWNGARGPVLFCIGSNHPVTLAQQAAVYAQRRCVQVAEGAIGAALAAGQHVVLRIPRERISAEEVHARIAGARPSALVVSGGDTASLVLRAMGACAIELIAEIVPGVPLGVIRGGGFDGLPAVTKSGGFGDRDTLVKVADSFHAPI